MKRSSGSNTAPVVQRQLFHWGPHYELGIPVLDSQHRKLALLLNTLQELASDGRIQEGLAVFKQLVQGMKIHFREEERLMAEKRCPELDSHRRDHRFALHQAQTFLKLPEEKQRDALTLTALEFRYWFRSHILGADKRMSSFLNP